MNSLLGVIRRWLAHRRQFAAVCGVARSPHWPAFRKAWLAEHPTCEACGHSDDPAVHHVKPFHLHRDLELSRDNVMTLCAARGCHEIFGHHYSWRSWNVDVRADAAKKLEQVKHRP